MLRHIGVLPDGALTHPVCRTLEVPDDGIVASAEEGLFEPAVELGAELRPGDVISCVHRPSVTGREPVAQRASIGGTVVAQRALAATERGDCLVVIARSFDS